MAEKSINSKMLDSDGNSILTIRNDNIIKIFIKLRSESRKRFVGFINTNTKVLYVDRQSKLHLMRKFNAYGFCHKIIQDAKLFNAIRLHDERDEWLIPTSWILDKDNITFLHFKGQGFEKQVFLPLEHIEQFKRQIRF